MSRLITVLALLFLGVIAVFDSVTVVSAGEQAVVTRWGAIRPVTLDPGVHFIMPLSDDAHIFETREVKEEVDADSASRDLQSVSTRVAVNYHLAPGTVNKLYQEIGNKYKERIIDPAVQESVKAATARFTAEELITKRPAVKEAIVSLLKTRLESRYILVDDVAIVNFGFSADFDRAIEAKQVAEQQAQKAKQDLARVKIEAEQKIAQAKAEAEALRLQKNQLTPELLKLRAIEAQLKFYEKWDGKLPQYMLGESGTLLQLPSN